MASSSLSQEDVDHDFELSSRRSRIRSARASARNAPPCRVVETHDADGHHDQLGSVAFGGFAANEIGASGGIVGGGSPAAVGGEHDVSPKPASRAKEKRSARSNHINKGKVQRERRKLREKRRSSGVVHLPSTESTGGSTGEDEDELLSMAMDTRRNMTVNEVAAEKEGEAGGDDAPKGYPVRNTKSPSDLDADDEDNQDYDSTVNQSDSAVSLLHETGVLEMTGRIVANGRPETPCSDNIEELLDRVREENRLLLGLLRDRDEKVAALEQRVQELSQDLTLVEAEKKNLQGENLALLSSMASLRTT